MQKKTFLIILLLNSVVLYSGAQVFQWAKQFECPSSVGTDIVVDKNRNVISAGWFQGAIDLDPGPGVYNPTPVGVIVTSAYLTKFDPNGNLLWGGYYNTGVTGNPVDNVRIHSIDVDDSSNIFVMGMYRTKVDLDFSTATQWVNDPTPNTGDWDNIFIAKYDSSSNYIWSKTLHSRRTNNGYGLSAHKLVLDNDNNILLSGRFNDTMDFDPGPGIHTLDGPMASFFFPIGDKFLLKLDAAGNFQWARNWKATENWVYNDAWYGANELDVDPQNNIFIPINFVNTLDIDPSSTTTNINSQGEGDVALVKMSPTGSLLWYKQIGDSSKDLCNTLATDEDGNVFYMIRTNSGTLDVDPGTTQSIVTNTNNQWSHTILKLDSLGDYLWSMKNMTYDANTFYWGEGMATNHLGDLYLTSRIYPNSTINGNQWDLNPGPLNQVVSSAGSDDMALQHFDGQGNFIFGGVIGGSASDWSYNICADNGKGVHITGHFFLSADLNPTSAVESFSNTGTSYDAFVLKLKHSNFLDEPESVDNFDIKSKLYPNPSHGNYRLELDQAYSDVQLVVRAMNGQLIWSKRFDYLQETEFSIEKSSGVYQLYIIQNGRTQIKKLLKW